MMTKIGSRIKILLIALLFLAFYADLVFLIFLICGVSQHESGASADWESDEPTADSASPETPQGKELTCRTSLEDVELILQNPELPNGCEVTSLAMILSCTGVQADKLELFFDYLPKGELSVQRGRVYGPNPEKAYVGNASDSTGWYCFEGPILTAGNDWLEVQNLPWQMNAVTGLKQEQLEEYLEQGAALIVWVTLNYEAPQTGNMTWHLSNGRSYTPYYNLHCVVLTDWNGKDYQVADPLAGWQTVSPEAFWDAFDAMGRRAVTLTPKS